MLAQLRAVEVHVDVDAAGRRDQAFGVTDRGCRAADEGRIDIVRRTSDSFVTDPAAHSISSPQEKETAPLGKKLSPCCSAVSKRSGSGIVQPAHPAVGEKRFDTGDIAGLRSFQGHIEDVAIEADAPVQVAGVITEF